MTQHLGHFLNSGLGLGARSAHYSEEGTWYSTMGSFPGVLFDPHGYILFETKEEYQKTLEPYLGDTIRISGGISRLSGYRRLTDFTQIFDLHNKMVEIHEKSSQEIKDRWDQPAEYFAPRAVDLPPRYQKNKHTLSFNHRLIQETVVSRAVKYLHGYRCQICGETLDLGNGNLYAETHHLQPMARPHRGPDVFENVICVCPNHHVQLDYRALRLTKKQLNRLPAHQVSDKYIEYSNSLIVE